jgi:hypothetical protein
MKRHASTVARSLAFALLCGTTVSVGAATAGAAPAAPGYTYTTVSFAGAGNVVVDQVVSAKEYSGTLEKNGKYELFAVDNGKTSFYDLPYSTLYDGHGPDTAGEFAGTFTDNTVSHGFTRSASGKLTQFDAPGEKPGNNSFINGTEILGVTSSGTTFGTFSNSADTALGFIDRDGKTTSYKEPDELSPGAHTLPPFTSIYDVLSTGEFGGTFLAPNGSIGVQDGFYTVNGTATTVHEPSAAKNGFTVVTSLQAKSVDGIYYAGNSVEGSFVDAGGQFTEIKDPNAVLGTSALTGTAVTSSDSSGQIAGSFSYNKAGDTEGFIATPTA